ncbi:Peroxisomal acyl-coenzyme A oxidase 1 [Hibiscus syriacus]|uniref:Acyl-coenzyme A oxidase n=1 Tax=Hibiscus syriacus TaxID=106335 RepID=A0A6A3AY97_HIBSY|nr:Peroxisomal acyl-coenzyme A oxidase 1 [Hibiscus syriacus]
MEALDYHVEERLQAEFNLEEMKIVWAGSRRTYEISDRMARLVAIDPVFRKDNKTMLSRKDLFEDTLRKAAHAWKRITFVSLWWPGGLGNVSTHAMVYARLITGGQDHGVHGFIVRLRSLDDHSPLPGITIGDSGMKFGSGAYNSMDNGLLRFDHVRIPRNQILMRVSQVTREGKFLQSDVPRQLVYSTMVYIRQTIVSDASCTLARAVCIATRYSSVRRQFGSQNGAPETQVIDYKTQQSRLFPLIASAYAFRFVGEWLKWLYTDVTQRLQANDFSTLPEDAIEECRKLCGGHGYLSTVARFLMKTVSQLGSGNKLVGTTAYMGRAEHLAQCHYEVEMAQDWLKPSVILEAFEARAVRMSIACAKSLGCAVATVEVDDVRMFDVLALSLCLSAGFADLSVDLLEAAIAHCQLIVVSKFIEKLQQDIPGKGVKRQMEILCNVYALHLLHKHLDNLSPPAALPGSKVTSERTAAIVVFSVLISFSSQVRPNAIALVDVFNYTEHYLGSVLGCYDGNVYQKLYQEAWKDPLNDTVGWLPRVNSTNTEAAYSHSKTLDMPF